MPYDYIIIGAGSAGCVLANRLSEDAGRTVLLLEAATATKPEIPSGHTKLNRTSVDWAFWTEPRSKWITGKFLFPWKTLGVVQPMRWRMYVAIEKI